MESSTPNLIELQVQELTTYKKPSFFERIFSSGKEEKYLFSLIPIESLADPATLQALILSMVIGKEEAMQMAMTIEDFYPTMPYPADLFKTATDAFGYKLDSVTIDRLDEEGIYHSTMRYSNGEKNVELHARVADAVTMALKHRSSIYAVREILKNIE